jgi:solute carrier family 35 protein
MSAMEYITVTAVLVFRALTPLVTALLAIRALGEVPQRLEWLSLGLIVLGAVCYLASNASYSFAGYVWMSINVVAAAAYHVYVKRTINHLKPSPMVPWLHST